MDFGHSTRNTVAMMGVEALIKELARLLEGKKCLIVLDDLSSRAEWDHIIHSFPKLDRSCCILVTTREESIAKHCSKDEENIYKLKVLEYKDAQDLFARKVFKEANDLDKHPELIEEEKIILKKCNGLPLAIVTIGGFLANQPKVAVEWRKLNEHISAELEMNPELEAIKTILGKSYDGLPYHLKSCFLYMSIFPEDHKVSRRRLIRRWSAEGYSMEIRDKSPEEVADRYFMELIERSMILPSQLSVNSRKGIDSCQVHDLMREIGISKSIEENLVFRMEEGCSSNTSGIIRHLVISTNWEGDKREFESVVDLSRIHSLTVFGKWRPFFISDKMRFLHVLDLEGTSRLANYHLEHIGRLRHLRYLSLRGCNDIFHLPDSIGNLTQRQTLDLAGISIWKLPKTITKLRKLQYLRVWGLRDEDDEDPYKHMTERLPKVFKNNSCILTLFLLGFCVACCAPHIIKVEDDLDAVMNRRDVCMCFCCLQLPALMSRQVPTQMPRGIRKLKSLRTLGIVNIGVHKAILRDLKMLAQLRKLAVAGINKVNGQEFCSVLANLSCLESLLVQSRGLPGLHGCLDGLTSAPNNLQSLKLYGNLVELPGWVGGLQNLVKFTLRSSRIPEHKTALHVLGKLQNLVSLPLWPKSLQGEDLRLTFHPEAFPSLMVLELNDIVGLKSVEFEDRAMLQLERLDFRGSFEEANTGLFSGLPLLPSLKVFRSTIAPKPQGICAEQKNLQGRLHGRPAGPACQESKWTRFEEVVRCCRVSRRSCQVEVKCSVQ
ncbi:disease resistance protein RPM1-like [Panicum miliaceum]|uniref:Disease resistance protein RPM1-like n=1 Tax=Panicum miliaceum TaxID=4540 RepID=A0A3L6RJE9_PANMI|nr:disease resistance protein RPM1-like [Panicum miliaceum]